MKTRYATLLALTALLIVAMAAPAVAGEKSYKCTHSTQDCLDMMANRFKTQGWLGVEMEIDEEDGKRTISRVVPGSPAEAAGFEKGDVWIGFNDVRFAETDMEKAWNAWTVLGPGDSVDCVVTRAGTEKALEVELAKLPTEVMYQMVGMHMMEHADGEQVAKAGESGDE